MRTLACGVVILVFAGALGMIDADEPMPGSSPEQQAAPQEQAAVKEPASTQPTIAPSGPAPPPAVAPFDAEQAKRHQEAWARHLGVPVEVTNSIGLRLVLIPPGEFVMGSAESTEETAKTFEGTAAEWFKGEHPQHRVRITKPFHLGAQEVTQEHYKRVMGENPSHFQGPQLPVEQVSRGDAIEFCRKLSALPEEKTAGRMYRLPTEAQWEYACRAGSTTRFSFGDDNAGLGNHGWLSDNSSSATHQVGKKQPNAWGLYDMHGNVVEWCADWYDEDYYKDSPVDDPTGPTTGSYRVLRGGSWYYSATICRSAMRTSILPHNRCFSLGFRVAVTLPEKTEPPKEAK